MDNNPLVSIVINYWESIDYLDECIKSVQNQSYKNWEIIFIDNNSKKSPKIILSKIQKDKLNYFKLNNYKPLGQARNIAIEKSSGELIAFIDTDDLWHENKLYIVGGDLDYDQSEEILIFDLSYNNWLESFKMPIKISNHTTGIYKNRIFIKGDFNILNLLAVFDITQSKFSIIESNVTESRYLTSQIVNGEFYVMGGNATSNYSTMTDDLMVLNLNEEGYFCF